jgi:DNA-binding IclR family transcriptional regulator
MTASPVPENVRLFLVRHIDSVPALEALLMLGEDPQRLWSAEEVAARTYVDAPTAAELLRGLETRGLIAREGDPPRHRYAPADAQLRAQVVEVAQAYRTHLIPMANIIHSKASVAVQEFARAFDLKKDR